MNYRELSQHAEFNGAAWAVAQKVEIDAKNVAILAERQKGIDARAGIDVGDFVIDGDKVYRVAHDWDHSVQLTDGRFGASFYLSENGFVDFSGGLDSPIDKSKFKLTDERREGSVWFFSEDHVEAHNGYHTTALFRVWGLN
jgi:hypothetical protein